MTRSKTLDLEGLGPIELVTVRFGDLLEAEKKSKGLHGEEKSSKFVGYLVDRMLEDSELDSSQVPSLSGADRKGIYQCLAEELGISDEYESRDAEPYEDKRIYEAYLDQQRGLTKRFSFLIEQAQAPLLDPDSGLRSSLDELTRLSQSAFATSAAQRMADSMQAMGALNLKLVTPAITAQLIEPLEGLTKTMAQIASTSSIQSLLDEIRKGQLVEPFHSTALLMSQLESPLIHTPTYAIPAPTLEFGDIADAKEDAERQRLVASFDTLSRLEISIRRLLEEILANFYGEEWWSSGVPPDVREGCEERQKHNELRGGSSHHPIYYGYIFDYLKIVIRKDNWQQIFEDVFSDKDTVNETFKWVGQARVSIAHSRPITEEQHMMFMAGAKWLQTRIDRAFKEFD